MYVIRKEYIDGIDWLPDIVDTPIWRDFDPPDGKKVSKEVRIVAALYKAVANRDNYFQEHTPTAFGNPEYSLRMGIVEGILLGAEVTESRQDGHLIYRKGKKTILKVDIVKKTQSYYDTAKENRELRRAFGF